MTDPTPTTDAATSTEPNETAPPDTTTPTGPGTPASDDPGDENGSATPESEPDNEPGREAAKWRRKLRDAETTHTQAMEAVTAERDTARELLDRTRAAIVDQAAAGLNERQRAAAGITPEAFLADDGTIDHTALNVAVAEAMRDFAVPRKPDPVPALGRGGSYVGESAEDRFTGMLRAH
ncbi:hypothetical protein [Mycolicibacterium porcinum]|uniref:Scaffolding protein n=1 Tax=Mycolicibacterium porcinum TaxID=39693 RepID=A0ABV3VNC0_9MYCO